MKEKINPIQIVKKEIKFINPEVEKKGEVLTPKMQYISNYVTNQTFEGRLISLLKKNPDILFDKKELMRNNKTIIKLKKLEIIKTEIKETTGGKKEVTTIHEINPVNQIKIWGDSHGPKILELFEENTKLTASDIRKIRHTAHGFAITELTKLHKSGFLDTENTKGERGAPKTTYFLSKQF